MPNDYTLRISITPTCNLNCLYCNRIKVINYKEIMSKQDLIETIKAGFDAGIRKISWTGGEPTTRPDFIEIIKETKDIGMEKQSMTTNGILYYKMADKLKRYGINKINFSLDTLYREEYKKICDFDGLKQVLLSIKKATKLYKQIKINCVVMKSNMNIIKEMVNYFDKFNGKVIVRFLEIVPFGLMYKHDKSFFGKIFFPIKEMIYELEKFGKLSPVEIKGDVPKSLYFKIDGKNGTYGVNPNYSVGYKCAKKQCPKIRVSPHGFVSNCTTQLKYVRDFRNRTLEEKKKLMKEIVLEKQVRKYSGFKHKQKYYDFWRFGINPAHIKKRFYGIV